MTFSTRTLALSCARHPRRTLVWWGVAALVALVAIATLLGGALTTDSNPTNNPQSLRARDVLDKALPANAQASTTDLVVIRSTRYVVDAPQYRTFVGQLAAEVGRAKGVVSVHTYLTGDGSLVSQDRHAALIALSMPSYEETSSPRKTCATASFASGCLLR